MSFRPVSLALSLLLLATWLGCEAASSVNDPFTVTAHLVELLRDPHPDVRRTAALSLGKIGHSAGVPALVKGLGDPDPVVREYSAWALGEIGEEDVNTQAAMALVGAIGDERPAVKRAAAQALGKIGTRQPVIDVLIEALAVGELESRRSAVHALAQLEGISAYPALLSALGDRDARVRQGAVAALGELGDPRALPALRKRLLRDRNVGVRTEAAFRIGKLGGRADLPFLQKAANTDPTPLVHLWAMWALQNVGDTPNGNPTGGR